MLIGLGNLAGVYASNWYRAQDAPEYLLGHGMEIMMTVIGFINVNVLRWRYKRINKQRDAMDETEIRNRYTEGKSENSTVPELG